MTTSYEPTSLGALTTIYTPPASRCSDIASLYNIFTQTDSGPYQVQGPIDLRNCYPDRYNPGRGGYYSPGICPSGFTVACSSENRAGSVTETVHTCCPEGLLHTCISDPIRFLHSTLICASALTGSGPSWTIDPITQISGGETEVTALTGSGGAINAYGIEVRFQSTDFQSTETSESGSQSSISVPIQTGGSSDTTQTSEPTPSASGGNGGGGNDEDGGGGLSTGATAGIAIGAALGGLLIGALLLWMWFRRRRQRADGTAGAGGPLGSSAGGSAFMGAKQGPGAHQHELPVPVPHELASSPDQSQNPNRWGSPGNDAYSNGPGSQYAPSIAQNTQYSQSLAPGHHYPHSPAAGTVVSDHHSQGHGYGYGQQPQQQYPGQQGAYGGYYDPNKQPSHHGSPLHSSGYASPVKKEDVQPPAELDGGAR